MIKKTILYLRVDLTSQKIVAGGSVAHTLGVIKSLLEQGATVHCASTFMGNEIKDLKPHSHRTLKVPRIFNLFSWRITGFLCNFSQFIQLLFFTRKKKVDYIYQRHALMNSIGAFFSYFKRVPLILEYNGSAVWGDSKLNGEKQWRKFLWLSSFLERLSLHRAHTIVVVSQLLKNELMEQGISAGKILVNPNGVDTQFFDPEKLKMQRKRVRQQFNLHNKFVIGYIGSFYVWHGLKVLENIIPEVIKRRPQAHFLLIGDGALKKGMQKALAEKGITQQHVTFTGSVPQEKGREYLAACEAYISPTQPNRDGYFFGSPTKVFEYMSLAKPVIASDLGQITELINPAIRLTDDDKIKTGGKHLGFLLQPNDEKGFVQVCTTLIDTDTKVAEAMGRRARQRAIDKHTWQAHVQKIFSYVQR